MEDKHSFEEIPPPPGIIHSLKAGFDLVANNIAVILLPVFLDLFLWLGPKLQLNILLQRYFQTLDSLPANTMITPENAELSRTFWTAFISEFNLLSMVRTIPVGVSSLMFWRMPTSSPTSALQVVEFTSWLAVIGSFLGLVLIGWFFGALYFYWIAKLVYNRQNTVNAFQSIAQTFVLSLTLSILLIGFGFPLMLLFGLLFFINQGLASFVIFFVGLVLIWLIVPIYFSAHGIFARQENAFKSIINSLKMSRFTLPTTSLFVIGSFILSRGLSYLWSMPDTQSWLTLVGIFGHAFVTTSLLAASFVYYKDMNAWLSIMFSKINSHSPITQA